MAFRGVRVAFLHLRPLAWAMLLAIGLMLVMSLLEGFGLGMLLPIIQAMQAGFAEPGSNFFSRYTAAALSFLGLKFTFLNLIFLFSGIMLVKFSLQACLDLFDKPFSLALFAKRSEGSRRVHERSLACPTSPGIYPNGHEISGDCESGG